MTSDNGFAEHQKASNERYDLAFRPYRELLEANGVSVDSFADLAKVSNRGPQVAVLVASWIPDISDVYRNVGSDLLLALGGAWAHPHASHALAMGLLEYGTKWSEMQRVLAVSALARNLKLVPLEDVERVLVSPSVGPSRQLIIDALSKRRGEQAWMDLVQRVTPLSES